MQADENSGELSRSQCEAAVSDLVKLVHPPQTTDRQTDKQADNPRRVFFNLSGVTKGDITESNV